MPARCVQLTPAIPVILLLARPPAKPCHPADRAPLTTKVSDIMRKAISAAVAAIAAASPLTAPRRWRTPSHDATPGMPSVSTARGARRLRSTLPAAQSPAGRSTSGWSAKKISIRKIAAALAAAALTMGIVPILAAPVATAGPPCAVANNASDPACIDCGQKNGNGPYPCYVDSPGAQVTQAPIGGPQCDEASKYSGIKCPGQ
jgi:hypothetical protein